MKGIILAGGAGSRLYPITQIVTKQLQPIYDKPMICYPLSLLMLCGIKDILLITTAQDLPHFEKYLGNGKNFGINISYKVQDAPNGIAEAFILGEEFIGGDDVTLILGDNLFHGDFTVFRDAVKDQLEKKNGIKAQVFAYPVTDPERYGVVEFDKDKKVISIEEKPANPKSNFAVPGLYIFDADCVRRSKVQKPSARGELEIIDLIETYRDERALGVQIINRGMAWLDTGTPQSMLDASSYISAIDTRQGLKVACLEEVALRVGFLSKNDLIEIVSNYPNCDYKKYIENILKEEV
jgi:glucose-1-phosphate thymidylyltransferase